MINVKETQYQMFAADLEMMKPVDPQTLLAGKTPYPSAVQPVRTVVPVMLRWQVDYWSLTELQALQKSMESIIRVMVAFDPAVFLRTWVTSIEAQIPGRYFLAQAGNFIIEHKVEEIE